MKCREFEDRLNLLLDERLLVDADAQISAHAAGCEPCRQLLAGQLAVFAGLQHGRAPRLGADFSRRVVAQAGKPPAQAVVLDGPPRSRRAWLVVAGLVATAAAVLVAVSIAAFNSSANPHFAADPESSPKPAAPSVTPGQPSRSIAANAPASRPNKRSSRRTLQPGALSLFAGPSGGYRVAIADMASTLPDAVEKLDEVERYAPGIRPIRVSFTMLLDALWRAIPGTNSDGRGDENAWHSPLGVSQLA